MFQYTDSPISSQVNSTLETAYFQQFAGDEPLLWWYAYAEDAIPQLGTRDTLMNYTGPFQTERDAFIALVFEMLDHVDRLENFALDLQKCECFYGYALPIAHTETDGQS